MKSKALRRALSLIMCAAIIASMFTMSFTASADSGIIQDGDMTTYAWDFTDIVNGQEYADEMDEVSVKFDAKGGIYGDLYAYNEETGAYEIDTSAGVSQQLRGYVINNPESTIAKSYTLVGGGLADFKDQMLRPGIIFASDEYGYYGLMPSCKNGLFFQTVFYFTYKNGSYTSVNNPNQSGMNAMYISSVDGTPVEGQERELSKLTDKVLTATTTQINAITWSYQVDYDDNGDIIVVVTADYDDGEYAYSFVSETYTFNLDVLLETPTVGTAMAKVGSHYRFEPRFGFFSIPTQPRDYYAETDGAPEQDNQATQVYSIYAEYLDAGDQCLHPQESLSTENYEDATCTEDGYTGDIVCGDCQETLQEGEVVAALGHAWKETERVDATTESDGYYIQVCTRCEEEETIPLDQLDELTVTFVGEGGEVLDEQAVGYGLAATAPEVPESSFGYEFIGWDTAFDNVTSDLTVTAVFYDPDEFSEGYVFDFNLQETSAADAIKLNYISKDRKIKGTYNAEEGGYIVNPPNNALHYAVVENPLHMSVVSSTLETKENPAGIVFAQDENGYYLYRVTYDLLQFRRNVVYLRKTGAQQSLLLNQGTDGLNPKLATIVAIDDQPLTKPTPAFGNKQTDIGYDGLGSGGRITADLMHNFSTVYTTYVEDGVISIDVVITYDDGAGNVHTYTLETQTFSIDFFTDESNDYAETNQNSYVGQLGTVTHDNYVYVTGYYTSINTVTDYVNTTDIRYMSAEFVEYSEDECIHDQRDWSIEGAYYDCETGGETGTTLCLYCGETVKESEPRPPMASGHGWVLIGPVDNKHYRCQSCGATKEANICKHEETTTQNAKDATCTAAGYSGDVVCSSCGETVTKGSATPALGHDKKTETTKAATCTEKGEQTVSCSRCDYTATEEIAALGHDEKAEVTKPATCTEKGEQTVTCSRCDYTATEEIEMIAHNYVADATKAVAPTCVEGGKTVEVCQGCGDEKETAVPALGHDTTTATTKEATCTESGTATTTCSRCDYTEEAEIPALGHTEGEWETVKEPTADEEGSAVKKCTVCEEILETKTLDKLPAGIFGDVNGDGMVNTGDASVVARNAVGLADIPEGREAFADVNGDGMVNTGDAMLIARLAVGLIDKFPAEQ